MAPRLTEKQCRLVLEMYADEKIKVDHICRTVQKCRTTIQRFLNRKGVQRRPAGRTVTSTVPRSVRRREQERAKRWPKQH
jgi:IS30 family transposase